MPIKSATSGRLEANSCPPHGPCEALGHLALEPFCPCSLLSVNFVAILLLRACGWLAPPHQAHPQFTITVGKLNPKARPFHAPVVGYVRISGLQKLRNGSILRGVCHGTHDIDGTRSWGGRERRSPRPRNWRMMWRRRAANRWRRR
eukprot:scaffold18699_cov175-Isochrysis_galbana.AAC.2